MKSGVPLKTVLLTLLVVVLLSVGGFVYTRFFIPQYHFGSDFSKMTYKGITYVRKDSMSETDTDNLGKIAGIVVPDKRTVTDLIWPFWVSEYRNDKEHNHLFVRGLMDLGTIYNKEAK